MRITFGLVMLYSEYQSVLEPVAYGRLAIGMANELMWVFRLKSCVDIYLVGDDSFR